MGASLGGYSDNVINQEARNLYGQGYSGGQLGAEAIKRGISQEDFARATGLPPDVIAQAYAGAVNYQNNSAQTQPNPVAPAQPQAATPTPAPAPAQPLPQQTAPPAQSQTSDDMINSQFRDMYSKGFSGGQLGAEAIRRGISQADFARATGLPPDVIAQAYAGATNYQNNIGNPDRDIDNIPGVDIARQNVQNTSQNRQFDPYGNNPFANSQNPFVQAAQQNAAGNLAGAQMATAANRVNQSTPYQNLQYKQTGVDAQGNPIWSAEQSLAPGFQQSLNNIQSNVAAQTAKPFDVSSTQNAMTNAQNPNFQMMGEAPTLQSSVEGTGMSGWDRANELLMSRLRPQMEQRNAALDAKLANQGIVPGTEAYNRARMAASQADNDMMIQAQLGGSQLQNQMFNQNLQSGQFRNQALGAQNQMGLQNLGFNNAARQQGFGNEIARGSFNNAAQQNNFQQNLAAYNNPLQQLNAFTQGTNPNYVNYYNQQPVAGPDYFGAYNTTIANQIAQQNAQMAANSNTQSGFFDLGAAALRGGGGIAGLADSAVKGVNWLTGKLF